MKDLSGAAAIMKRLGEQDRAEMADKKNLTERKNMST